MKITEEYMRNSLLHNYLYEAFFLSEDTFDDELFIELTELLFLKCNERFGDIIEVITNLKQCKYAEARIGLRNKENYQDFKKDILNLRTAAKRLLEIIIVTSAITNEQEIRHHKLIWQRFDNFDKEKDVNYYHQHIVYQQFKKVERLDELAGFNSFLHQYLVEMAFKLAEIFIRRINFTIGFLKNEEAFKEICVAATFNVRNFRKAIESLKSKTE
jgi:hypothetical protein